VGEEEKEGEEEEEEEEIDLRQKKIGKKWRNFFLSSTNLL